MPHVADLAEFLETFAPAALAEPWDNVGLLVGRLEQPVMRVMTCLTITPESVSEAIAERADLIVTHHPLPFRPLKRLTGETPEGQMLLDLIGATIAVYSPHTAFDSAAEGINQRLAAGLELQDIVPLVPTSELGQGAGRHGRLAKPCSLTDLTGLVKKLLGIPQAQAVGPLDRTVTQVAVACGSAGEFLTPAQAAGCDALVTGEVRFHTALEAEALGMGLVLAGHFASERFALDALAGVLARQFRDIKVWASRAERDPIQWL